jgi:hypothetical protein
MNTLPRAITARFFTNSDTYNAFRKQWSDLINSGRKHELAAAHHLLYLALTGKDWRKAFTPFTNQRKLGNGSFWNWGLLRASSALHNEFREQELLAPFEGLITPEMLRELRSFLPVVNPYGLRADQFTGNSFPFDAYIGPALQPAEKEDPRD